MGLKNVEHVGLDLCESESDTVKDDKDEFVRNQMQRKSGIIYKMYIPRVLRILGPPPCLSSSDSESDSGTKVPCGWVGVCSKDRQLVLRGVLVCDSLAFVPPLTHFLLPVSLPFGSEVSGNLAFTDDFLLTGVLMFP